MRCLKTGGVNDVYFTIRMFFFQTFTFNYHQIHHSTCDKEKQKINNPPKEVFSIEKKPTLKQIIVIAKLAEEKKGMRNIHGWCVPIV